MTSPGNNQNNTGNQGSGSSGSGNGDSGGPSSGLMIDWGGKVNSDAPTMLTMGQPVTATYASSVTKATITVDDQNNPATEAWTKQFKFGPAQPETIQARVSQSQQNPREVTVEVTEWPGDVPYLSVNWGARTAMAAPTTISKDKPTVTATYAAEVTKATITVDDDNPATEAFSKVVKFDESGGNGGSGGNHPPQEGGQNPPDQGGQSPNGGGGEPPQGGSGDEQQPPEQGQQPPSGGEDQQPPPEGGGSDSPQGDQPPQQDGNQNDGQDSGSGDADQGDQGGNGSTGGADQQQPPQQDNSNSGGDQSGSQTYTVQPGDTLSEIAVEYGTTVEELQRINNISDEDVISVGQELTIPGRGAA